jgi:two-component system, LuxR family, response regulator FixJ
LHQETTGEHKDNDSPQQTGDKEIVYVVEADDACRLSIVSLLESIRLPCQSFATVSAFLESYDGSAGCVITDLRVPYAVDGIDLQKALVDANIPLPVIIVSASAETSVTVQAMKRGAITILERPFRNHELLEAIPKAFQQGRIARRRKEANAKLESLTEKERDVLERILDGLTTSVIARRLDISVRAVENRRHQIYLKTQTNSIAQLVRLVVESDLEDPA